jgi:hypothetical protein
MRVRLKLLLATMVVAVVGVCATPASAEAAWFWAKKEAQNALLREGLDWDSGHEEVLVARCVGQGRWIWNDSQTVRLFRKFRCFVFTTAPVGEDEYYIRFLVKGKFRWDYEFLHYA